MRWEGCGDFHRDHRPLFKLRSIASLVKTMRRIRPQLSCFQLTTTDCCKAWRVLDRPHPLEKPQKYPEDLFRVFQDSQQTEHRRRKDARLCSAKAEHKSKGAWADRTGLISGASSTTFLLERARAIFTIISLRLMIPVTDESKEAYYWPGKRYWYTGSSETLIHLPGGQCFSRGFECFPLMKAKQMHYRPLTPTLAATDNHKLPDIRCPKGSSARQLI